MSASATPKQDSFGAPEARASRPASGVLHAPAALRAWAPALRAAVPAALQVVLVSAVCSVLVFGAIGAEFVVGGMLMMLFACATMHLLAAAANRAVVCMPGLVESAFVAVLLQQAMPSLAAAGLADTQGLRISFVCLVVGAAGVVCLLLFAARLQRLAASLPSQPVSAFMGAMAVALVAVALDGLQPTIESWAGTWPWAMAAALAFMVAATARRRLPAVPAAVAGLAAAAVGLYITSGDQAAAVLMGGAYAELLLPWRSANFAVPAVALPKAVGMVLLSALILGAVMFLRMAQALNSTRAESGKPSGGPAQVLVAAGALALAAGTAGAPLQLSARRGAITFAAPPRGTMLALVAAVALVIVIGPAAALLLTAATGVLLSERWASSPHAIANYKLVARQFAEQLAIAAAVGLTALIVNLAAAALVALVLSFFLFAVRSARQPVRRVWSGRQVASNCVRSPAELAVLRQHGDDIRVFELEGEIFFPASTSLQQALAQGSAGASCLVMDWSRVRNIDTSIALALVAFESDARLRGQLVIHAGADMGRGNLAGELARHGVQWRFAPDLDFALEQAENQVIHLRWTCDSTCESSILDAVLEFTGLSAEECQVLQGAMFQKSFRATERLLVAGDASDELMIVLKGSVAVFVQEEDGRPMRLAGVRPGGLLGEVGFLDGSPRSADVVAQEDTTVAVLTRQAWRQLAERDDPIASKLLVSIAVSLAGRLRHMNEMALARSRLWIQASTDAGEAIRAATV